MALAEMQEVSEVVIYDNLCRKNYNLFMQPGMIGAGKCAFIKGDILDSRKLKSSMAGSDIVIHLAGNVSTPFANEDSSSFEQVNHWGTAEVCHAAEENKVKRFIYLSSTSVYGSGSGFTSQSVPAAETFYGISKYRGEKQVEYLIPKMDVIILRCGNVYGYSPAMRFDAVINRFMFEANFYKRISIQGNGKQSRAFIHVDRATDCIRACITGVHPGTYNLVDKNLSVTDIAYTLKEIYPELEFIFINQHLSARDLKVERDTRLDQFLEWNNVELKDELCSLGDCFSFRPDLKAQVR